MACMLREVSSKDASCLAMCLRIVAIVAIGQYRLVSRGLAMTKLYIYHLHICVCYVCIVECGGLFWLTILRILADVRKLSSNTELAAAPRFKSH